jgi:hypothetical protein
LAYEQVRYCRAAASRREIKLDPDPASVRTARDFVRSNLCDLGFPESVDDAVLIASELVTNAGAPRGALSYPRCSREELEGGFWV